MKVEIINATETDPVRAAALLIFTKMTRLQMTPEGYQGILEKVGAEPDWANAQLDYMSKTIKSSWEFLDITFSIQGITRACAQQMTRTRFTPIDGDIFGSYAMQSQRVTDMSSATYLSPAGPESERFRAAMKASLIDYSALVSGGMSLEDARGVLPMNLHCNLIAKYNLRMLVDLVKARTSGRAQGEFQELAKAMHDEVVKMWPWAGLFFRPANETAISLIDEINKLIAGMEGSPPELKTLVSKVRDQII